MPMGGEWQRQRGDSCPRVTRPYRAFFPLPANWWPQSLSPPAQRQVPANGRPAHRIIPDAGGTNCDYVLGPFQTESDQRTNWLNCLGYDLSTRSWDGPHSVIGYGGVTL